MNKPTVAGCMAKDFWFVILFGKQIHPQTWGKAARFRQAEWKHIEDAYNQHSVQKQEE